MARSIAAKRVHPWPAPFTIETPIVVISSLDRVASRTPHALEDIGCG
jgi:hypothetical protein